MTDFGDYILAIDQGTTGSTALLINGNLEIKGKASVEYPQHFPKPGWVEHDLEEIWASVAKAVSQCIEKAGIDHSKIVAIGITNQRETVAMWEAEANAPAVGNAIVWQDRRTAEDCEKLKKQRLEPMIQKKTGLLLDPYFSATKIHWRLKQDASLKKRCADGKVKIGTIETYLLYRMTQGNSFKTDVSNASRTLLMDLKTGQWDEDLLKLFKVPVQALPEISENAIIYGYTRNCFDLPDGIPITGLAGDQQAALFGQACFKKGELKCTYGTGAFALANIGNTIVYSKHRLLTTVAWKLGGKMTYGLEGSCFIAGAIVQWLRDGLHFFQKSEDVEKLANTVEDSDGVMLVPALSGLGAPHWEARATGLITGLTRGTTKAHVAKAALQGMAFQVTELLEAMRKDFGKPLLPLRVDGGASANDYLMQFQSDLLEMKVVRSKVLETTGLGVGLQAGLGVGLFGSLDEIQKKWAAAHTFSPKMKPVLRNGKLMRWKKVVAAVKSLA